MVLQNSRNSEKVLVCPYGEVFPGSHDASQATYIKTEEVSDAQEDAIPMQIMVQEMKAEPEVSCVFLHVHFWADITDMLKWHLSCCLSVK
jgi:hypothetical protein